MKFKWDKKYLYWGFTGFCALGAAILFYYLLFHTTKLISGFQDFINVCMPIIFGLIMAYLLTPVCAFFERIIFTPLYRLGKIDTKSSKIKKRIRFFSITITMILFAYVIYAFFSVVIPGIIKSIQSIILQFPIYVNNLEGWIQKTLSSNPSIEKVSTNLLNTYSDDINGWLNDSLMPRINIILKEVSLSVLGVAKTLWNFIIGFIISIYVLGSRETFAGQSKKILYAFFQEENANNIVKDFRYANRTFGAYISGKIIDSIIIGILCFIFMNILHLPYVILVSVIIGLTNIIPFFGPFLGGIPSALLILMVDPMKGLIFIILIVLLQQFDGNILGPKILGDSTGLSSFWVIFSITIFGAYFGILGMAIGVPIFALIYAAFKRWINNMLTKKGLTINTRAYMQLDRIENSEMIQLTEEQKKQARKSQHKSSGRKTLMELFAKHKTDKENNTEDK